MPLTVLKDKQTRKPLVKFLSFLPCPLPLSFSFSLPLRTPTPSVCLVSQSCLTLWESMDCSLPGSCVHGILQARILEWVTVPFSRGSSWSRDQTRVSCIASRFFTLWATGKFPFIFLLRYKWHTGQVCFWPAFDPNKWGWQKGLLRVERIKS